MTFGALSELCTIFGVCNIILGLLVGFFFEGLVLVPNVFCGPCWIILLNSVQNLLELICGFYITVAVLEFENEY